MKRCDYGNHEAPKLWRARTKTTPSVCARCMPSFNRERGKVSQVNRKQIAPVSTKQAKKLSEYRKLRDQYMAGHPRCEVCGCVSTDLHHKKPRASYLCDVAVFMAVCRPCHDRIHSDDAWARSKGYLLSKYDQK